jgi:hypothetical protein
MPGGFVISAAAYIQYRHIRFLRKLGNMSLAAIYCQYGVFGSVVDLISGANWPCTCTPLVDKLGHVHYLSSIFKRSTAIADFW